MSRLTKLKSLWILCMLGVGLLWPASPAEGSITVPVVDWNLDKTVVMSVTWEHPGSTSPTTISGHIGLYELKYGHIEGIDANLLGTSSFCIEPQLSIKANYELVPVSHAPSPMGPHSSNGGPMGAIKANYLALLWGQFFHQIETAEDAAAFSLAVSEIVFENLGDTFEVTKANWGGFQKGNGNFYIENGHNNFTDIIATAQLWLSGLDEDGRRANLMALTDGQRQDLIVEVVPEPASLAIWSLIGLSFLGAGLRRRRRRVLDGPAQAKATRSI